MTEPGPEDAPEAAPGAAHAAARIEAALRSLGAELRASPGWEARVLAASRPPARRRWTWLRGAAFAGALAAAVLVLAVWRPWPRAAAPPELAVVVDRRGGAMRGGSARVGDVLRVSARRGPGHRAIWIYRGRDELVAACPGGPACTEAEGALAAAFAIELVGTYTVVALWSARPLPAPAGTHDEALAAAERRGAERRVESIAVN